MVFDQDPTSDPLVRNQLKIAQLDSREKTLKRQLNEYLLKTNRLEEELANSQNAVKSCEDTNLRLKQEYIKAVENAKRLEIAAGSALPKKQAALIKAESENLRLENTQLRGALNTFRNLHEAAVREAKTLRVSIGRSDDENTHLRKEIRELQSLSDENALIGKLFNQVLAEKWTEAAFNKKYETMHDELRKARSDASDQETKLKKKEAELIDLENSATTKIQALEKQLFEANLAINPTIPLSKIEELNLALKRISNQKVELEIANKQLRADFAECQIRLDSYVLREQNLRTLEASLKGAYSDELSQKVIELSEKLSTFKLAEMKALREAATLKEREEYYMRVNKGQTAQIAALEEQVVHHMNHLNERENFWRQRHNDQMKLLTRQESGPTQQAAPQKRPPTTPSHDEVRRIVSDGMISMDNIDSQRGLQPLSKARDVSASYIDSEMQILRDKIKFLEDDVKYKDLKIQKLEKEADTRQIGVNYRSDNVETHVINDLETKTRDIAQAAQHTVVMLQTIIEEKNQLIHEKEHKIDRLQAELADKSKQLSKLELDNEFLQKKQAIEDRARMNVEQYTALKTIDKMSKMDLKDTQKVIADYENKLKLLADQLIEAEAVNKELMQTLRTNKAELNHVKDNKSLSENILEIEKLKKDHQTMTNMYKKKCLEVKNLNEVLMKYTKDLEAKQDEISKIRVEEGHKLIAVKNEGGNYEEKIAVLSKKYTTVSEQLKEEKKQLQEFKKSEIKFNERIAELNDKLSKLTEANTKLKDENAKLAAKKLTAGAPVPQSPAPSAASKRPTSVQRNPQPSSTNLPALPASSLRPAARSGEADEREVAELKEERRQLLEEVADLRRKQAAGPGTQDFIDEDGHLYLQGAMSFKSLDEVVAVLRRFQEHAGPKLNYFAVLKRADPRRIGCAPADKIFAELDSVGARFSDRNKRIVQEHLPKDAGGLVDYKALCYLVAGGRKDFTVGVNREDLAPQVRDKPLRPQKDASGVHTAVLDKNLDLLKKKLLDKEKEVAELTKQLRNWKQTALGYEAELKEKTNAGRGRLEKGSTVENVIKLNRGENLKQIQDLEEQIRTLKKDMKFEVDKREQLIKEVQEDLSRRTYEMTLAHSEVQNLRGQLARLTGAKLAPEQLQAEREKEKELLVASLMERLEKSRKAEEELRNKLRSIERENIDLKHVKEGIDTKLENLNRELRELRNKKPQD